MLHMLHEPLYHGTIIPFKHIDVLRGKGRRDFGRGFYMAVSSEQAIGMMHKKFREALSRRRMREQRIMRRRSIAFGLDRMSLIRSTSSCFRLQTWSGLISF